MSKFSKKDAVYLTIIVFLLLTIAGMRFMPKPAPEPIVYNYLGELETYAPLAAEVPDEIAIDSEGSEGAESSIEKTVTEDSPAEEPAVAVTAPKKTSSTAPAAPAKVTTGETININTASHAQLMRLPGVGEVNANKIIEYRNANGRFNAPKDILKVSGIGQKTYEKIQEFIEVD